MPDAQPGAYSLEELPAVKWRCIHCRAAFQELQLIRADGRMAAGLKCHRCKKITRVEVPAAN